jgi:hypothetical protein
MKTHDDLVRRLISNSVTKIERFFRARCSFAR